MDLKKQNKILLWAVLILFIGNIVTLTSFWIAKPGIYNQKVALKEKFLHKNNFHAKKNALFEELDLSAEQKEQFKSIRSGHFKNMKVLKDSIKSYKHLIYQEIFSSEPNDDVIRQLSDSIGLLNAEFEKNNFEHFLQVKQFLDNEQLFKLQLLLEDASFDPGDRPHYGQHRKFKDR